MITADVTVADWLDLIRSEYAEIPGLSLTQNQAQRLWNLDPLTCNTLLQVLIDTGFLKRRPNGTYVRAD